MMVTDDDKVRSKILEEYRQRKNNNSRSIDFSMKKMEGEYFNDDFIGLSMSEPTLERLTKSIGVYYKKIPTEGEIDFYDHTGSIFILNKHF